MRAALSGVDAGLVFVSRAMLDQDSADLLPEEMRGRPLLDSDLRRLARMLTKQKPRA
jgi:hypothetical protein